ncbi:hypothetical protein [uncultured Dokdonia sp.]|uniref:hypothetical protein n=1 Tax=uncultured Dokdonia sp. TaxID=575653 RepID=UPI00263868C5|nr:hypothetical protein [uncultured Dokdonia sp.]
MKKEHKLILDLISSYLEKYPDQRFGQAIFNLGVNEFIKNDSSLPTYNLRDIYNDEDSVIIKRIENQLEWFNLQKKVNEGISNIEGLSSMTVNERLFRTGLLEQFDIFKKSNKNYAKYILESLDVDSDSIKKIIN